MSNEAREMIAWMTEEMSSMKYAYTSIMEGAFEYALGCGLTEPPESKEIIFKQVTNILNQ